MIRHGKIASALLLATTLCTGQPWTFAQELTTTHSASEDEASFGQGAAYWSAEKASEAQPIPWYEAEYDPDAFLFEEEALGPAESAPGGPPSVKLRDFLRPQDLREYLEGMNPQDPLLAEQEPDFDVDFGTQNIGDNDYVNKDTTLWTRYPWRTIGKLLLTTASGGSGYCTASVISPNNVIVTAAHCCYDRGAQRWNGQFAFVPAMRNTSRPYGTFPYTSAIVLSAWISSGGRQNDVCVLKLGPNERGQTVASVTGWLGRSWNHSTIQHHFAFGYPSNIDSGIYKYECSAESYANCGNNSVYGMGCNMTFGSSGGPWVRVFKKYSSGAMNYVNSVVSGYDNCTGTSGQSFNGARFTSNNIVPLCNAAGC